MSEHLSDEEKKLLEQVKGEAKDDQGNSVVPGATTPNTTDTKNVFTATPNKGKRNKRQDDTPASPAVATEQPDLNAVDGTTDRGRDGKDSKSDKDSEAKRDAKKDSSERNPELPAQFEGDGWDETPVQMRGE